MFDSGEGDIRSRPSGDEAELPIAPDGTPSAESRNSNPQEPSTLSKPSVEVSRTLPAESIASPTPPASATPTTWSLIASTCLSLAVVLVLLATLRYLLPTTLELSRYSWYRGQLRAEYETAGEQLKQVSIEGLSSISQTVARRVVPSVVHITTSNDELPIRSLVGKRAMTGHGSGVVVDPTGFILTNSHVLDDGPVINVFLADERTCIAELIGKDPLTDLAVLKIQADQLLPISWGDSDQAEIGSPVWAVGSPFGLTGSITFGIVSSKHRLDLSGTQYDESSPLRNGRERKKGPTARYSDLMQTDVAVNPGNSGGPLVNGRGELIGINTAIIGESYRGVSFAIPSNLARQVCDEIIKSGKMRRGWLGVEFVSATRWEMMNGEELVLDSGRELTQEKRGAVVNRVLEGSPAEQGGLLMGDIVVGINGVPIKGVDDAIFRIGTCQPGSSIELEIERDAERTKRVIEIGQRPEK
ncbi:MAG: trypsin-like peptidase domain-containing protein [Planctomycetes bacterium]|nr:trypsin-like peptidase domain-containing protein [Planctomycetota bacterium]